MRRLVGTAAVISAAVLSPPGAVSRADEVHVCTAVGCESIVTVDADAFRAAHLRINRVVLCVEGRCHARHWRRHSQLPQKYLRVNVRGDRERSTTVKVVAYDRKGHRLFRKFGTVFIYAVYPNGAACPPACFVGAMRMSSHGRLRQTDH